MNSAGWQNIRSPMIRQLREMICRIPKKRKTTLDVTGNITVDQHIFSYDKWSTIVPRTIELLRKTNKKMSIDSWWDPVVDLNTNLPLTTDATTGDITLVGVTLMWIDCESFPIDEFNTLTALC
jgi:hypothetical protein